MKSKFAKKLKWSVIMCAVGYVIGLIIGVAVNGVDVINNLGEFFGGLIPLATFGVSALLALVYLVSGKNDLGSAAGREGKTKEGDSVSQYYDAKWISEAELLKEKRLMPNTWETLPLAKKAGLVVRCALSGNKLLINMYDSDVHCLVIGTSGSGKTTFIIDPTIRIFAKTQEKPCMIITDPKGELYEKHAKVLKDDGYRVMVLDLRNPFASTRWNPMDNAYMLMQRSMHLEKEVKVYKNADPHALKLKIVGGATYGEEWYEFEGVAYPSKQVLEADIYSIRQMLKDEAENELREIAATIVTIESQNDQSWERGAQDYLYGIMLAMLEDSQNPELGMSREKFNFYNLGKIANFKDSDPDNMFGTIRKYCDGRGTLSKVQSLTSVVINNAPNTARSYLGVLSGKIGFMQDSGICYATSINEMSFDDFDDAPTAFFIKVPDEKESRHAIATMCISQLYKKLINIASKKPGQCLPRQVYFLLDEFANLPKIPKMDSLITVARSRRIFFELVVQSYSQLDNKYGKDAAETIRGNCNMQIFLGTEDQKTKEEFSKMCGEISIETKDVSESRSEKKKGETTDSVNKTSSKKIVTRPLVYPYELGQLEFGTAIIKIFKMNPIKTKLAQFHKTPMFEKKAASDDYVPVKFLDEQRIFYDITVRNKKVLKNSDFDDFDF